MINCQPYHPPTTTSYCPEYHPKCLAVTVTRLNCTDATWLPFQSSNDTSPATLCHFIRQLHSSYRILPLASHLTEITLLRTFPNVLLSPVHVLHLSLYTCSRTCQSFYRNKLHTKTSTPHYFAYMHPIAHVNICPLSAYPSGFSIVIFGFLFLQLNSSSSATVTGKNHVHEGDKLQVQSIKLLKAHLLNWTSRLDSHSIKYR